MIYLHFCALTLCLVGDTLGSIRGVSSKESRVGETQQRTQENKDCPSVGIEAASESGVIAIAPLSLAVWDWVSALDSHRSPKGGPK